MMGDRWLIVQSAYPVTRWRIVFTTNLAWQRLLLGRCHLFWHKKSTILLTSCDHSIKSTGFLEWIMMSVGVISLSHRHSVQWKHSPHLLQRRSTGISSAGNAMASTFCDATGNLFGYYLQKGHNINGGCWGHVQWRWRPNAEGKWGEGLLLYGDNTPEEKSLLSMAIVRDCGINRFDHRPSSDSTLSDYHLLPSMERYLAGKQYHRDNYVISPVVICHFKKNYK